MSEMYDCKTVTTRKPHVCDYCGNPIEPNTPGVMVESGLFEREFFRRYACSRCQPLIGEFWDYVDCESANIRNDWCEFIEECHPELVEEEL